MPQFQLHSAPTFWRCEPGWSWVSPVLADHLLWCVLDGRGRLELDGATRELHPGVCALFGPGDAPTATHDPRRRLLVFGLHFDPGAVLITEPRWGEVTDRELLGNLARRMDSAYRRAIPPTSQPTDQPTPTTDQPGRVEQAELCLRLVLSLVREAAAGLEQTPIDPAVEEVARLIREDPGRPWTVADMARRAALSRAQFTRRFVAQLGRSPAQYLIQARIDRAHQLLTESGMTVTQTAQALGYTDVPYFSRQYKQRTGRQPSQER